ncbi:MAG: LysR substrate-binding domain-containing protein, partial [Silanimonas sp.]
HGTPEHPSDLATHRCLMYLRAGGSPRWGFERERGRKAPERVDVVVSGPFKANNSELLREAALGGAGIALLPDFSCAAALEEGALVPLLKPWRPVGAFGDRIYAIRPYAGTRVPRALQCFVDFLRQRLGTDTRRGRVSA